MKNLPNIEPLESRIAPASAAVINLADLDGTNGFKISGEATPHDYGGVRVQGLGDINGDSFDDFIVAAPLKDECYVVFGRGAPLPAGVDFGALDGTNGFTVQGSANSVASAGDINGDGFGDVALGYSDAQSFYGEDFHAGRGFTRVIFGRAGGFPAVFDYTTFDGIYGFTARGNTNLQDSYYGGGGLVGGRAGDINGDGFDDLILGSRFAPSYQPDGYVLFGKADGFTRHINLDALADTEGFEITGGRFNSIGGADDVNGDGFDDLLVGATSAGATQAGKSYIVFGKTTGFGAGVDLSALNGSNGFTISGENAGDFAGVVSSAGDFNRDGLADVLIGAPNASSPGSRDQSGRSYIVFGAPDGFAADINLFALNGTNGFEISGIAAGNHSGDAVSGVGDVNDDGFSDVLIGATYAGADYSGAAYIVFGKGGGVPAELNLASLDGTNGFAVTGLGFSPLAAGSLSVSGAGDFNGDGFSDFAITSLVYAPGFFPKANTGATRVVFGHGGGFSASFDLATLDGTNGFGAAEETIGGRTGSAVRNAGDVNGDGLDDVIIGAPEAGGDQPHSGAAYVVFGNRDGFPADFDLASLDGSNGFKLAGVRAADQAGFSVSGAGDFNGDGFADVLVGASRESEAFAGEAYLVFGKADGFTSSVDLGALGGADGFKLGATSDPVVSTAGDINGDGFDDICVGSYVVFGKKRGFGSELDLRTLSGADGFRLVNNWGAASGAGDVNGDGFEDLIVPGRHTSYVIFGRAGGWSGEIDATAVNGLNGFAVTINAHTVDSGYAPVVSSVGDMNGDGFADVVFKYWERGRRHSYHAASYVVFGHGGGFAPAVDLAIVNGSNGFKLKSPSRLSLSAAGDVNGDGFGDMIIGGGAKAYVVFGHANAFPRMLDASKLNGANGVVLAGVEGEGVGGAVSGAGDVNGDGFADLLVGAPEADSHGLLSGASYVVFGRDFQRFVFTDTDGDRVTVKAKDGILDPSDFVFESTPGGQALAKIDVSRGGLTTGANLKITATPHAVNGVLQGDGKINIGRIDASGIDLGKISIDGNLGAIDAGSGSATTPAIFSLVADSMRAIPKAGLGSRIDGDLHGLKIVGDLSGITLDVTGQIGRIGKAAHGGFRFRGGIEVGGSIEDARLATESDLARLEVAGNLANTIISARGDFDPIDTLAAQTIGSITIEGTVDRTTILAGYDRLGRPSSADVQAGEISVGGSWRASSIAIGVDPGSDGAFGTEDDALIGGGVRELVDSVARIVIKGQAFGGAGGADHFGFVAEQILACKIGGVSLALTPGADSLEIASGLTLRDGLMESGNAPARVASTRQ